MGKHSIGSIGILSHFGNILKQDICGGPNGGKSDGTTRSTTRGTIGGTTRGTVGGTTRGTGGYLRLLVVCFVYICICICTHELTFGLAEPPLVSGPADALVPPFPLVGGRALTLLALMTTGSIVNYYKQIIRQATESESIVQCTMSMITC